MPGNQPFSVGWLVLVLVSSGLCIAASLAPFAFLMRPLRNRTVSRLSPVARWLLVLPAAFFAGWLGEVVPRFIFSVGEILLNRQVLFRPGFDSLVWQLWSPFLFVMGGVLMVPRYRLATAGVLGGFKAVVAVVNIVTVVGYVRAGGEWSALDPLLGSPLWWNTVCYAACLAALASFVLLLWKRTWFPRNPHPASALEVRS